MQSRCVANSIWQCGHHSPFPLPSLASANPGRVSWGQFLFLFTIPVAPETENTHALPPTPSLITGMLVLLASTYEAGMVTPQPSW